MEVVPYPAVPNITAHADSLISSWASENQWYREGTLLGGATNWYYIPTQPGNYQVAATNGNGCNSDLSASYFFTSLEDDILNKNISIYPNPTTGLVNIEVPAGMENYSLHILNLQGKILLNEPLKKQTTDLSNLESGIYVLQLFQDQQLLKTSKIVLIK
ncbi:MAG: T9SS type A sorting domain-containing protein [Bacteroidales bacterium]|nr:T9SS type A sorting domain-containing protein [Bacteroidales bacterium]